MGIAKTRVTLQGSAPGNLNNPDDGIVGTNLDRIQAIELNRIMDDMIESSYNLLSDDTDSIAESATRKFLDSSVLQTILGNKVFSESVLFEKGLGFFGATPVIRPTTITSSIGTIPQVGAPVSADYSVAAGINASAWGFASSDEFETFIQVVRNMQSRINELENRLTTLGLIG